MKDLWCDYLEELKYPALIGPGLRENLPSRLRRILHVFFITFRYIGFYLLFKPIASLIAYGVTDFHVHNRENLPRTGAFIGTLNHLSNFDPMLGALQSTRPLFAMTKSEYFSTPILGGIVIALGGFPVRRGEADRQAVRTALAIVKRGGITSIFPEGTRSKTFMLQDGHPGAALIAATSDVPVVPNALWGTENIMRRDKLGFLKRPRVDFMVGKPYNLKETAAEFAATYQLDTGDKRSKRHSDLDLLSDIMMLKMAELLPPQYQGEFTPAGVVARFQARAASKNLKPALSKD